MSDDPPLAGLRVLDLGQGVAGPYCAQLLADQGADVIKVEPPRGDWGRTLGSRDAATGQSSTFIAVNHGKRSVCLDLADEAHLALLHRIAGDVDVIVESFRPGVMARLALDYDAVREINPSVIYCSITGFGSTGPMADAAASDSMMQAYGGLMSVVGEPGGEPMRVGVVVSDMIAGGNAFAAVLLGLLNRATSGRGHRVEVSLLDTLLSFQSAGIVDHLVSGQIPAAPGNRHPLIGAAGVAQTVDGWLAVGILDHYWETFAALIDDPRLHDARFATGDGRLAAQDELWRVLDSIFATKTAHQWVESLRPAGIVCSPVLNYGQLVAEPQVVHNGSIYRLDDDTWAVKPALSVDGTTHCTATRAPQLGEHTDEVAAAYAAESGETR